MREEKFIEIIKEIMPESTPFIGDDAAYLEDLGLIVTKDVLIENVHFMLDTTTPSDLGFKSIAVNFSDIAAMGGICKYVLIGLSLPKHINENFVSEFYKGVKELTTRHNAIVIGGDITSAERVSISVTVIGAMEGINPAKRNLAKEGQVILTTGFYGASKAGLWLNQTQKEISLPDFAISKYKNIHNKPLPQLGFGRIITNLAQPNPCMMDTSDGLADALYKVALSSKVSLEVEKKLIPIDTDLKIVAEYMEEDVYDLALFGGEDYQILACVDEEVHEKLAKNNIPVRKIGVVKALEDNNYVKLIDENGESSVLSKEIIDKKVFDHFEE